MLAHIQFISHIKKQTINKNAPNHPHHPNQKKLSSFPIQSRIEKEKLNKNRRKKLNLSFFHRKLLSPPWKQVLILRYNRIGKISIFSVLLSIVN
jgi:hypothetical protein